MNAAESRGSEDVELMSTCHAQGHHVRTILVAPLRTIAGYRITLDRGDDVNVVTGGVGDE